ncbi:sugar phosphate isomerase/epimerase family protein [Hydrogenophaga sp. MI9]|uniref:sugar phosphate isomerase/epimerase family protein n=1 Tax=Hydrogenophaga sp. MI9 TaxID=3453719 RepID=UPI003EEE37E5
MATSMHALGIAPLTHLELSPADMVGNARDAGYDFLGLRLVPATPTEPQHDCRPGSALLRETLARLRDSGLRLMDIEIFRLKPETDVGAYEPLLEAGALLGARHALVAFQDSDPGRLGERFFAFSELAARHGLGVDVEPTPWYEVSTLADTAALIRASGARDAGIVVDAIHFDRAGENPQTLAAIDPAYFRYAQLCDAPAERPGDMDTLLFQARAERQIPGDGGLPLRSLLAGLPPGIALSLEVPMQSLARRLDAGERARRLLERTRSFLARTGDHAPRA